MWTERKLHEDAADRCVVVELLDHRDDLLHSRVLREGDVVEADPDLFSSLGFHANINGGVWAGSSLDDRQLGLKSRVFGLPGSNLLRNIVTERPKVRRDKVRRELQGFGQRLLCDACSIDDLSGCRH